MSFCELLAPTKTEKHGAIEWTRAEQSDTPFCGVLTITGKRRKACAYRVEEFPADHGRGFILFKQDGTGYYSCRVGGGLPAECECSGFVTTGGCKHVASITALIENGQL